ncbi:MAG TPA: iron-containing redox enzyme family protein [Polyangiaceae bacterium]|nr:iron-containing redox enzyme family protein [Polyangiaceae bacterium]
MTSGSPFQRLQLENWSYDARFLPVPRGFHPVVAEVAASVECCRLHEHPFFELAARERAALGIWLSQELVMTNAFSQLLMYAASNLVNVHQRAVLSEIAFGEHGAVRGGLARRAHPWLLHRLREAMQIPPSAIVPAPPTLVLIEKLAQAASDPITATAALGAGNEHLILPEYRAIKQCFRRCMAEIDYAEFLDANLSEDVGHSRLCYELGSALIETNEQASAFKRAALASVEDRLRYFDELHAIALDLTRARQGTAQAG